MPNAGQNQQYFHDMPNNDNPFERTVAIDYQHYNEEQRIPASVYCVAFDQTVQLSKVPFCIGRNQNGSDLCILDNEKLSGHHAEIDYRDGSYYITDLNSTNHVFINGKQIMPNTPVKLETQAKFTLGDEQFIFYAEKM